MKGSTKAEWLDEILHDKKNRINPSRSEESSSMLSMAAAAMQTRQRELHIPRKSIAIIDYLANNPRAVIIADENVKQAFEHAKEAVSE